MTTQILSFKQHATKFMTTNIQEAMVLELANIETFLELITKKEFNIGRHRGFYSYGMIGGFIEGGYQLEVQMNINVSGITENHVVMTHFYRIKDIGPGFAARVIHQLVTKHDYTISKILRGDSSMNGALTTKQKLALK